MIETAMSEAFRRAGYEPAWARFRRLAMEVIARGGKVEDLAAEVRGDIEIITALCAPSFEAVLKELGRNGGQNTRTGNGRTAPTLGRPSQAPGVGQDKSTDNGQARSTPAWSPSDIQPAPHKMLGGPKAKSVAAKHALAKVGQVASIFARPIGAEMRYGSLTRFDVINLRRKGQVVDHITGRLLTEVSWPNDVTPLEKCASEALAKDIYDSAYRVLEQLGLVARAAS